MKLIWPLNEGSETVPNTDAEILLTADRTSAHPKGVKGPFPNFLISLIILWADQRTRRLKTSGLKTNTGDENWARLG